MTNDAVVSPPEAVRTPVHEGDTVALEGFSHLIPFAAGHEIIRRSITSRRRSALSATSSTRCASA